MNRFDNLFVLGLTFLLSPLGALAQVASADKGTINDRDSNARVRRETARPVRLTIPPKAATPIALATLPNATCSLHPEGDTTQSVKLFADEEGTVRFHVSPSAESDMAVPMMVDCEADGVAQTFPLALRPNSTPTADMPAPAAEVRKPRPGAFVRPALTGDEAATLSDEELAARGYRRRPDPKDSPKAHAAWSKAVTQPMTFVPPTQAVNPGTTHDALNGFNWSGVQLVAPANVGYSVAEGSWYVPAVVAPGPNNAPTYSGLWVGLDSSTGVFAPNGTLKHVLVQAGTAQNTQTVTWPGFPLVISTYYAWTEFLPQDPSEKPIQNFVVRPGDLIACYVWIGGGPIANLSGPYAWFEISNVTTGTYTIIPQSRSYIAGPNAERLPPGAIGTPLTTNVNGSLADWVMERPTVNGAMPSLANFGQTQMWGAYAGINNTPTYVPAYGSNTRAYSMFTGYDFLAGHHTGNLLSYPTFGQTCTVNPVRCSIRPDDILYYWVYWN